MRRAVVLGLLFLNAACVSHVAFRPREHVDSESPGGIPAASYSVEHDGRSSEVRLWTTGVEREEGRTIVRVEFEVENRFAVPIVIAGADVHVEAIELDDGSIDRLERVAVHGSVSTAPGAVGISGCEFVFPEDVGPGDVRAFSVRWKLAEPVVFEQQTAFRRAPIPAYRGYYEVGFPLFYYRHSRPYRRCPPGPWL
ncbi:MAG: hypothetical protein KDB80_02240 [Planctomycetes bacterium]|nr:hypothetical protein [Planctomycetota bacterium]